MRDSSRSRWVIVLAAGVGSRLAPLTRHLYGHDLPKQFAVLDGERSLLQETMARMEPVAPPRRTVVVVAAKYLELAVRQLDAWRGVQVMAQPENRGTGPGILWPLARVLARDPGAQVVVTPSDHHVPEPGPYLGAIRITLGDGARRPATLLGVRAERADTEYGWIVPRGHEPGRAHGVEHFVEKPRISIAKCLLRRRALWNTFVFAGSAQRIWKTGAARLPRQAAVLAAHERSRQAADALVLARAYARLESADFSREVLSHTRDLGVVAVEGSGWNDWGTPERVLASLEEQGRLDSLLVRIWQRQLARPETPAKVAQIHPAPPLALQQEVA